MIKYMKRGHGSLMKDYDSQLVYSSNRLGVVCFKFTIIRSSKNNQGGMYVFTTVCLMNDDVKKCFGSSVLCTSYFTLFGYTYVTFMEGALYLLVVFVLDFMCAPPLATCTLSSC